MQVILRMCECVHAWMDECITNVYVYADVPALA